MIRIFVVAIVMSCFTTTQCAQAQSAPTAQAGTPPIKPAAKNPAPKVAKAAKKPSAPAESGPCQLGVIAAIGDKFTVQKVGLTVFGNDETQIPIDGWGLDDLVVARVRAAAAGTAVRKIAYAKGALEPYYNPPGRLFRNGLDDLTAVVRQITANASCARYVVVTTYDGQLEGTNQTLRGIGVLSHGPSFLPHTSLFANISLKVFDGQTFAIHRNPPINLGAVLTRAFRGRDPLTELDNAAFPEPAVEAAGSATLRDRTRALVTANLDKALPAYLKEEQ